MKEENYYNLIVRPHISEKSTQIADKHKQFVFQVAQRATKVDIKSAIEKIFSVKVQNVRVVNVRGKMKYSGRTPGKRANWKKAYVCLEAGHDIDFVSNKNSKK